MSIPVTDRTNRESRLLNDVFEQQKDFVLRSDPAQSKQRGQVFSPPEIAQFMAGMFNDLPQECRILDPGAGIGILTAAFCERLLAEGQDRNVHVTLYEPDAAVTPLLERTLCHCKEEFDRQGQSFTFEIRIEDFLSDGLASGAQRSLFDEAQGESYDAVITNPPYFKINARSRHARLLSDVIHGQPNIYSLFLAAAAQQLRPNGEPGRLRHVR